MARLMGFLYVERQTIPNYLRINQSLPHLISHDFQQLDMSRLDITSSLRVLPPSVKLFEGLAHAGVATV